MHHRTLLLLPLLGLSAATASIIVQPVSVAIVGASATGDGLGASANSFINGTGLSNPSAYTTGSPVPAVWDVHALAGEQENGNYRTAPFPPGGSDFTFTFSLGGSYDLTGMRVWGYNSEDDFGFRSPALSINRMLVEVSSDGGSNWSVAADLTSGTAFTQPTVGVATSGDLVSFTSTTVGVDTVRFSSMDSFWSPGGGDAYAFRKGLAEVRFIATPVPEPSAYAALAGAGMLFLALLFRRRR